jgi:hypothetical protein
MDSPFPLPFALIGLGPAIISILRGRKAHHPLPKLVADAIPKAWFSILLLALWLPHGSLGERLVIVAAVLLALWDLWRDIRSYRRSTKREPADSLNRR